MEEHGERIVLPESRPRATSVHQPSHLLRDDPRLWREGSHPSLAKAQGWLQHQREVTKYSDTSSGPKVRSPGSPLGSAAN